MTQPEKVEQVAPSPAELLLDPSCLNGGQSEKVNGCKSKEQWSGRELRRSYSDLGETEMEGWMKLLREKRRDVSPSSNSSWSKIF